MPGDGSTMMATELRTGNDKVHPGPSARTRKGVVALVAVAVIGAMTMLGAISIAAAPTKVLPAYLLSLCRAIGVAHSNDEASYLSEIEGAMTRIMRGMDITSSGDVDHDFVEMTVPHHQGAIDMAMAVLRYGKNERLRRLAQEIIVTQQQEIAAMRLALDESLPPSLASPTKHMPLPPGGEPTSHDVK